MKSQLSFAFSNEELYGDWSEYLVLISPNRRLVKKINELKEEASNICGKEGIFSPPHITVAKLYIRQGSEEQVVAFLQQVCSKHEKFAIELEDFESFEHRDSICTIYIKVKTRRPFLKLANDLRAARKILKALNCRIGILVNNPHLSLVRSLPYLNYKATMPLYRNKVFKDAFIAEEIVMSKKWTKDDGFSRRLLRLSPCNSFLK